jgi:hypothetical protein
MSSRDAISKTIGVQSLEGAFCLCYKIGCHRKPCPKACCHAARVSHEQPAPTKIFMKMNVTTITRTTFPPQSFWTALVWLLTGLCTLQPASAVTLYASADTRIDSASSSPLSAANTADLGVGPISTNRYFRTYLAFDLSALTASDATTNVTLKLFNTAGEANTSALPQVYTLFQVAGNWDGTAIPGPGGTALATVNITPASGTDTQNIEFSSTNLANAFNSAIGGNLYLGIKTDKENFANRSFTYFQSAEDPNPPALTATATNLPTITVSVPDGSASEPGSDTATFTLNRGSATNSALTVFYTFSGTATAISDYTESSSGSVTFAAGTSNANVVITAVNDAVAERLETVILTLAPDAAYNIGSPSVGTATLIDDNDDNNNVLVRYIFTDANSIGSTFSLAPQVYATNVSASAIAAAAGIGVGNSGTAVSPPNAGYINSTVTTSNQTEAIANNDYFSLTLTPTIGHSLTLTNLELSAVYSVTASLGVNASIFVRSSLDDYTSDVASNSFSFVTPYTEMSIPLDASFTQVPSNITFRVYVFDDTDATGDGLRIDDIFVRGSIDALPPGYQQLNISATDTNAVENPSTPDSGQFSISRYGDTSGSLTVHYTVGGTAVNGVDYNLITNEVTMNVGVSNALINITPIDDLALEGAETVILTLIETNGYLVVAPASATVTINDDAEPSQVVVVANDDVAYEPGTNMIGQFTLTRNNTNSAFSVNFTLSGSATAGIDYTASATNSIAFAIGEATKAVTFFPVDDAAVEGTESVILTLQTNGSVGPDYILVANTSATSLLYDDELGAEKVLFSDTFETVDSSTNYLQLDAARNGVPDSTVTYAFDYSTVGVPAAPGSATTLGLRLSANKNDASGFSAAVNLFPTNVVASGNYAVRFNAYLTWSPAFARGEDLMVGINHSGAQTNWVNQSFGVARYGDGQYVAMNSYPQAEVNIVQLLGAATSTNAPLSLDVKVTESVTAVLNNPPYGEPGGLAGAISCSTNSPSKTWVDCELSQVGGVVTFRVNGWPALTYTNTSAFTNGYVMIGYMDSFDSASSLADNFALIDNLRIVDLTTVAKPVITAISVGGSAPGSAVTIDFTAGASDGPGDFTLEKATTVNGVYGVDGGAIISGNPSAPNFRATTTTTSSNEEYYRIRR